ncbi:LysR substrate-binding domain-containing protein [Neptunicella sp. SCSIO 80796]|uniref:LysR family transcriptional regulator n=1 Tax=Neptunicella plasticusilytica TaxID=3117012 RepID=UPI003A4D2C7B
MNISHRQLCIFVELANSRSFADAAVNLHLSQPALSIAIKKFEQAIGGMLLARSTRMVELTPEGRAFLPVAKRLLYDWEIAFDDLHKLFSMQRGKLTIASMPSFANSLLPDILNQFHQSHANINIAVMDVVMERVIEAVREDRAELGIIFEAEQMDGVDFIPLFNDCFVVLMNSSHPLSDRSSLSWQDLHRQNFIAMNRGSSIRHWCDNALLQAGTSINIVAEASQLSTVGQLVRSSLGLSVVPALCRQQMETAQLRCVALEGKDNAKRVGMIRRSRGTLSVPAQYLSDLLQQYQWDTRAC